MNLSDIFSPSLNQLKDLSFPCFFTSENVLINRMQALNNVFENAKIHFAVKSNYSPKIIKILKANGLFGIDTVSINEVRYAKYLGFESHEIVYTGNNVDKIEISEVIKEGVLLNIGSFDELKMFTECNPSKKEVGIRLNPLFGVGENDFVNTGGEDAKFGIRIDEIEELLRFSSEHDLKIVCLHFHLGSGIYDVNDMQRLFDVMLKIIVNFKDILKIDLGGGFGVRYSKELKTIDLSAFKKVFKRYKAKINDILGRDIQFLFEPGKFLVTESTVLLAEVTNVRYLKNKLLIGVNTGMNHNIRPPLYDAKHDVENLSSQKSLVKSDIYGNICESADFIAKNILINEPKIGDIICVYSAGGYCSSMSSFYNMRSFANEYILKSNQEIVQARSGNFFDFKALGYAF